MTTTCAAFLEPGCDPSGMNREGLHEIPRREGYTRSFHEVGYLLLMLRDNLFFAGLSSQGLKRLTKYRTTLYLFSMVKTRVSSKGQTSIPRKFLKLWKTSQVLWDLNPDGSARVSPAPNIMSLFGSAGGQQPPVKDEKKRIREGVGRNAATEGLDR